MHKILFDLLLTLISVFISHLNKIELLAVVLVITIVVLTAMDVSMRDITMFPLGQLSHAIHFGQELTFFTVNVF